LLSNINHGRLPQVSCACFSYYLCQGKEVLLLAVGALCTSCHKAILAEGSSSSIAILNLVSSACTTKGKKYREAALSSLEQVSNLFSVCWLVILGNFSPLG